MALLRAGVRLASLVPAGAQEPINDALRAKGVRLDVSQIRPENLDELTVDVDQQNENVKVRMFFE